MVTQITAAACKELLQEDQEVRRNLSENQRTPDLLSLLLKLLAASLVSSCKTKNPPARERRVLRVLPLTLDAGYEPPPASCCGQHGLIPTMVIRMREGIREV